MTIDELIINVSVVAEGVKQGVAIATQELKKLEKYAKQVDEIKLKVNADGIIETQKQLKQLETEVKKLKKSVNIYIKTEGIDILKKDLVMLNKEISNLKKQIKITVDGASLVLLQAELEKLDISKKAIEDEIKLKTSISGINETISKLDQLNQKILSVKDEINIKVNVQGVNQAEKAIEDLSPEGLDKTTTRSQKVSFSTEKIAHEIVSESEISKPNELPQTRNNETLVRDGESVSDTNTTTPNGKPKFTLASAAAVASIVGLAVGGINKITESYEKAEEAQKALIEGQKEYNKLIMEGVTGENIFQYETEAEEIKKIKEEYEEFYKTLDEDNLIIGRERNNYLETYGDLKMRSAKYGFEIPWIEADKGEATAFLEELDTEYTTLTNSINLATIESAETIIDSLKTISSQKLEIEGTQQLIDQFDKASVGTHAWREANNALISQYSYLQQNGVAQIDQIQQLNDIKDDAARKDYKHMQAQVLGDALRAKSAKNTANDIIEAQNDIIAENEKHTDDWFGSEVASSNIYDAEKIIKAQENTISDAEEKLGELGAILPFVSKGYDELTASVDPAITKIQEFYNVAAESATSSFDKINTTGKYSLPEMTENARANAKAWDEWGNNLAKIESATSKEFAAGLAAMGESGIAIVNEIATGTPEEIAAYAAEMGKIPVEIRDSINKNLESSGLMITGEGIVVEIGKGMEESTATEDAAKITSDEIANMFFEHLNQGGLRGIGKLIDENIAQDIGDNEGLIKTAIEDATKIETDNVNSTLPGWQPLIQSFTQSGEVTTAIVGATTGAENLNTAIEEVDTQTLDNATTEFTTMGTEADSATQKVIGVQTAMTGLNGTTATVNIVTNETTKKTNAPTNTDGRYPRTFTTKPLQPLKTTRAEIEPTSAPNTLLFDPRTTKALEEPSSKATAETENQINTVNNALWEQAEALHAVNEAEKDLTDTQKEYNDTVKEYESLQEDAYDADMKRIEGLETGSDATTDYGAVISELIKMKDKYVDNAEISEKILSDITDARIAENEKLMESEKKTFDAQIEGIERSMEISQNREGILLPSGEIEKYTPLDEIAYIDEILGIVDGKIAETEQNMKDTQAEIDRTWDVIDERERQGLDASEQYMDLEVITAQFNNEQEIHDDLMEQREEQGQEREDLLIEQDQEISDKRLDLAKKFQSEVENLIDEGIDAEVEAYNKGQDKKMDALESSYDAQIEALDGYQEGIEAQYDTQIDTVNAAADAEIEAYQRRIDEIDEILKSQEREEQDTSEMDEIKALEDQIKYEKDDANLYQLNKELADKKAEYEKRKAEEILLDEKDALSEKIDAAQENADAQTEIINQQKDQAIEAYEIETAAKKASIEEQKEAAILAMEEETAKGEEELRTRLENDEIFRKSKYQQAVENVAKEEALNKETQQSMVDFLTSPEFLEKYTNAGLIQGQTAGNAYAQAYQAEMAAVGTTEMETSEMPATSTTVGGTTAINANTEDVQENSDAEQEIINEQMTLAVEQYELAKKARITALEEQKVSAIKAMEEEVSIEEELFEDRIDNAEDFYEEKDQMAWDSADYLRSEEVVGIYTEAGNLQGAAYQGAIQPFLDIIATQIKALEERIAAANSSSSGKKSALLIDPVSRFASTALDNARNIGLGITSQMANNTANRYNYDQRNTTVNQTFNVPDSRLTPYQTKQAAKQALRLALE